MCFEEEWNFILVKETMVEQILTKEMIESGKFLIQIMDKKNMNPEAVLWFYFPDIQEYKLLISMPIEIKLGPKKFYKKMRDIILELPEKNRISLDKITLAKPTSPIISLLKMAIRTGPGISNIRFTNNVINGTVIDDAYIYRLL